MCVIYHFSKMFEKRYNDELSNFGLRVKYFRKRNHLTQLDLELKTNISRSDISKIENGLKNVEFFTITKIATALEIEIYELFKPMKKKSSNK